MRIRSERAKEPRRSKRRHAHVSTSVCVFEVSQRPSCTDVMTQLDGVDELLGATTCTVGEPCTRGAQAATVGDTGAAVKSALVVPLTVRGRFRGSKRGHESGAGSSVAVGRAHSRRTAQLWCGAWPVFRLAPQAFGAFNREKWRVGFRELAESGKNGHHRPPARAISFAMPRHPVRSVHRSHALAHMYTQLAAAVARGLTSLLLQQAVALCTRQPDLDQLLRLADGLARVTDRVQPRRCLRTSLGISSAGRLWTRGERCVRVCVCSCPPRAHFVQLGIGLPKYAGVPYLRYGPLSGCARCEKGAARLRCSEWVQHTCR